MRVGISLLSIVAAAGLACPVLAQDSTSKNSNGGNGLPGDALSPWSTGANQKSAYVVDLVPLYTSQGTQFGIAPVIKASKSATNFFSSLWTAQSMSQTLKGGSSFASPTYTLWTVPTAGVNSSENNQGTGFTSSVSPSGTGTQFGVGLAEFATADAPGNFNVNNIVGGLISYQAGQPERLYVTRVVAAVNMPNGTTGDSAQIGHGAVDSDGNIYLRADDFGTVGTNKITGVNYLRVRMAARTSGLLNQVVSTGGADSGATDWVLRNVNSSTNQHNTPSCIPESIAGRPVAIGSNFTIKYVHEKVAGGNPLTIENAATYLASPATDQRGGIAFSPRDLFFGGAGTAGILAKTAASTDAIALWGISTVGDVGAKATFVLPAAGLADPCEPLPNGNYVGVFDGYRSQVAARGGNGCVAIGQEQYHRGLAAATMYTTANAVNPVDAIAVVRFDPNDPTNPATTAWTLAAWTDSSFNGKPIHGDYGLDGAPFSGDAGEFDGIIDTDPNSPTYDAPIGRLALAPEVSGLIGPSISSPAFDSVGNVYFLSIVALNKKDGNGVPFTDFDTALIRAIYDRTNFCYNLDLMMELGNTFLGANSATRYQVQFLDTSDSNSVSSGTMWSGNVNQVPWNNINVPAYRFTRASEVLGGLVVAAKVVYDVNGDGLYDDPTRTGGNVNSVDEAYNVLFYIGNMTRPMCPADYNNDGFVDGIDYDQFNNDFENPDPAIQMNADFNQDGFVDGIDADSFYNEFEILCP